MVLFSLGGSSNITIRKLGECEYPPSLIEFPGLAKVNLDYSQGGKQTCILKDPDGSELARWDNEITESGTIRTRGGTEETHLHLCRDAFRSHGPSANDGDDDEGRLIVYQ